MTQHPNLSFLCGFLTDGTVHRIQTKNPTQSLNTDSKRRSPHRFQLGSQHGAEQGEAHSTYTESKQRIQTQNPNTEANTESISVLSKERRTRLTQNPNTESKHRSPHRIHLGSQHGAEQGEAHSTFLSVPRI